ncbi:MAG: hypothetical protein GY737_16425 [Desulfobacteraceae bacterium]|nr:hypothetical protein [Desulfobacteraceae bacterium]
MLLQDVYNKHVEYATMNWPWYWQHRIDIAILGGMVISLFGLLMIFTLSSGGLSLSGFKQTSINDVRVLQGLYKDKNSLPQFRDALEGLIETIPSYSDRRATEEIALRLFPNRDERNTTRIYPDEDCNEECKLKLIDDFATLLCNGRIQNYIVEIFSLQILTSYLVLIYWFYSIGGSMPLQEAPKTRNHPQIVVLIFGLLILISLSFVTSSFLYAYLFNVNVVEAFEKIEHLKNGGVFVVTFHFSCFAVAFLKLSKSYGFVSTVTTTGLVLLIGIIYAVIITIFFKEPKLSFMIYYAPGVLFIMTVVSVWIAPKISKRTVKPLMLTYAIYYSVIGPLMSLEFLPLKTLYYSIRFDILFGSIEELNIKIMFSISTSILLMSFVAKMINRLNHLPK